MDAALDAMRPLGYSEKFVREMVKELLKEEVNCLCLFSFVKAWAFLGFWLCLTFMRWLIQLYGEDGWFFIENDSYKVLLDHIFQKEEVNYLMFCAEFV